MKVARTVLSGGKDGDNFKVLPIATWKRRGMNHGYSNYESDCTTRSGV
ncbi:hypothetical protein DF16_pBMB95orf00022 (plasmid) [Bacillus thuringiensis serovar kurstaki str. YBT-1520]|nr:hypothetical protein DF16_pBMB95orf00022 [Bacillus thuringiensis serovar kurstaki str. YBT-1520]MEC3096485.1 hypothetical protein [Bacillus cereus]MEE2009965.1 hypothetical protein [Bacillus thuringiensis]